MMKKLFLLTAALSALSAVGQQPLVINGTNMSLYVSRYQFKTLETNGLAQPGEGSNQIWNYTANQPLDDGSINYQASTDPFFTGALLMLESSLNIITGRVIYIDYFFGNFSSGVRGVGYRITEQRYPIGDLTSNPTDSIIFEEQKVLFSGDNRMILKYPTTEGSKWSTRYVIEMKFNLTIGAFFLNKTPGSRRLIYDEDYEVVGWGKSSFPINGEASTPEDGLLIKRVRTVNDSFFLNGQPAPQAMLAAFGISQGKVEKTYRKAINIPRLEPRASFYYSENFAQLQGADYLLDGLTPGGSGVKKAQMGEIAVFPQPLTGSDLFITGLNPNEQVARIELMDLSGRLISVLNFRADIAGVAEASLAQRPAPGIYLLKISAESGVHGFQRISIQ